MDELFSLPRGRFFVIAGPCVIESAELCLAVARHCQAICRRLDLPYVFKASFDKANRSSGSSFRGPGIVDGLAVLARIRDELGVPVLTDIHETAQVQQAAEVVDVLQVPAFLARQTDLLQACGRTGRVVNVKKGQFMSPQEMGNAVDKIRATGNGRIWLTERGTFFGYNRLVNDFTALPVMRQFGQPVVLDITHSTQQPGGLGNASGGNPAFSPMLARAGIVAGVQGLFLECHPDPANARSDASSMIRLDAVDSLLTSCAELAKMRVNWSD
jgi:2-dehydro-3-deoxyphosphooctonate aldolase (KDO 8-P synthase)